METAMQAAAEIGIPIINCGPGGETGDEASLQATIDELGELAEMAEKYGVTLCVKAHVGRAIYNTPTTLAVDGRHQFARLWHRHGPVAHLSCRRKPGRSHRRGDLHASSMSISATARAASKDRASPKTRPMVAATSTWSATCACLHENGYAGPLDLEIIGAKDYALEQCCMIAAEARGHMQACLQACGAR